MTTTALDNWKKPFTEGVEVTIPSGNVIKMRPVSLEDLMRKGKIPDFLTPVASKALWDSVPLEDMGTDGYKAANDLNQLMALIVPASVVEPKIYVGDGECPDDAIPLEYLSLLDKLAVFQLALQPVNVLVSFRGKQIGMLASIPNVEVTGTTTKPDSTNI